MNGFIAFAEIAGAILASMGLALSLEWCALNGLMHLLPHSAPRLRNGERR